jgi:ABC-type multidrug transport system ATPase subunit
VNNLGRLVGFVPQEDTMHRELTVREILKSYALLRLPRFYDHLMVERVVQDVIEALQLDHVSDSIIGDETKRGISGGQRKRVNVGMEMVSDPSLLFLDEPTSGLDSTTSFDLVFALKALAKKGVNVITVLHQPSYPLYQMFTKVLLLGKGGRTVFLGASSDALSYFNHCGYQMPPFVNPADFFMDGKGGRETSLRIVYSVFACVRF